MVTQATYDKGTGKVSVWTPPTEEQFRAWLSPGVSLELLGARGWDYRTRIRTLRSYLFHDQLIAVAAKIIVNARRETNEYPLAKIPRDEWPEVDYDADVWETGRLDWVVGTGYDGREYSAFDIRFDPKVIHELAQTKPIEPPKPATQTTARLEADKPQLAKADAERFCRAMLAGWGDEVKQDWAHEKAVLFFPDRKVPRDWFRSILRSIRGPSRPGKKPKTEE